MKKIIFFATMISVFFTACHKTPVTTIIHNSNIETKSLEQQTSINMEELPEIVVLDNEVDEVFNIGEITVSLKGIVSKPNNYEDIHIYLADVINYNEYENNMTFLFGGYEDDMYRCEITGNLKVWIDEENGFRAHIYNTSKKAEENYPGQWGGIRFIVSENPVSEELRRVNMSFDEANKQANEVLAKIGALSFSYDRCVYREEILQMTPEGTMSSSIGDTLIVYYTQHIQGIPIRTTLINGRKHPITSVTFDSERVCEVWISEYVYEPYKRLDNCITYDEAIEIFKNYISKDYLNNGNVYNEVRFQYTITKEYISGEFVDMAVPYWFFNREDNPLLNWDNTGDIYINCIDGSVTEL